MHGAGNDFIIINNIEEKIPSEKLSETAHKLCTRKTSIGADGMMIIEKADDADFAMLFYNSDGSLGEMCGNGARCICRYGYEHGLSSETQKVRTTAGIVTGERVSERLYKIRLNDPSTIKVNLELEVEGKKYSASYIELGNPGIPHCIILLENWDQIPHDELFKLGKAFRYYKDFPKGANASFVYLTGKNEINAITFERGVEDFTLACGTGCGSIATALTVLNMVDGNNVKITMPGGDLFVTVDMAGDKVENLYLTGPTTNVSEGKVLDEDYLN